MPDAKANCGNHGEVEINGICCNCGEPIDLLSGNKLANEVGENPEDPDENDTTLLDPSIVAAALAAGKKDGLEDKSKRPKSLSPINESNKPAKKRQRKIELPKSFMTAKKAEQDPCTASNPNSQGEAITRRKKELQTPNSKTPANAISFFATVFSLANSMGSKTIMCGQNRQKVYFLLNKHGHDLEVACQGLDILKLALSEEKNQYTWQEVALEIVQDEAGLLQGLAERHRSQTELHVKLFTLLTTASADDLVAYHAARVTEPKPWQEVTREYLARPKGEGLLERLEGALPSSAELTLLVDQFQKSLDMGSKIKLDASYTGCRVSGSFLATSVLLDGSFAGGMPRMSGRMSGRLSGRISNASARLSGLMMPEGKTCPLDVSSTSDVMIKDWASGDLVTCSPSRSMTLSANKMERKRRIEDLEDQLAAAIEQNKDAELEHRLLVEEHGRLRAKVKNLSKQFEKSYASEAKLRAQNEELLRKVDAREKQVLELKSWSRDGLAKCKNEYQTLSVMHHALSAAHQGVKVKCQEAEQALKVKTEEVAKLQNASKKAASEQDELRMLLDKKALQFNELEIKLQAVSSEAEKLKNSQKEATERAAALEKMGSESDELRARLTTLENEKNMLSTSLEAAQTSQKTLVANLENANECQKALSANLEKAKDTNAELDKKLAESKAENAELIEIATHMEIKLSMCQCDGKLLVDDMDI